MTFLDWPRHSLGAPPSPASPAPHATCTPRRPGRSPPCPPLRPPPKPRARTPPPSFSTSARRLAASPPRLCACHHSLPIAQPAPPVPRASPHQRPASPSPRRTPRATPAPLSLMLGCRVARRASSRRAARLGRQPLLDIRRIRNRNDSVLRDYFLERRPRFL